MPGIALMAFMADDAEPNEDLLLTWLPLGYRGADSSKFTFREMVSSSSKTRPTMRPTSRSRRTPTRITYTK